MTEQFLGITEAQLDPKEAHVRRLYLGVTQEECAEVIQAISKINRFGIESYNPYQPETNNRTNLTNELGDVLAMVELLLKVPSLGLDAGLIEEAKQRKLKKMQFWADRGC